MLTSVESSRLPIFCSSLTPLAGRSVPNKATCSSPFCRNFSLDDFRSICCVLPDSLCCRQLMTLPLVADHSSHKLPSMPIPLLAFVFGPYACRSFALTIINSMDRNSNVRCIEPMAFPWSDLWKAGQWRFAAATCLGAVGVAATVGTPSGFAHKTCSNSLFTA